MPESPVFMQNVKIGMLEKASHGGYYFTWDSDSRRQWFATLEDLRCAFGRESAYIRFGGEVDE